VPIPERLELQQALIDAMRRMRQERGWSQDRLAEGARLYGLSWTRSTVSDLEATPRRRDLSIDEFLLLPKILDRSQAELAEDVVRHEEHEALLNSAPALKRWIVDTLPASKAPSELSETDRQKREIEAFLARDASRTAESLALRRAERNVARVLNVAPIEVAKAALRLWNHGVTEERDRRVDETPGEGDRSRRLSHATRRLIPELRDEIGGGN
jgi:transcriptional regulator with XRE-family HTH domain